MKIKSNFRQNFCIFFTFSKISNSLMKKSYWSTGNEFVVGNFSKRNEDKNCLGQFSKRKWKWNIFLDNFSNGIKSKKTCRQFFREGRRMKFLSGQVFEKIRGKKIFWAIFREEKILWGSFSKENGRKIFLWAIFWDKIRNEIFSG